MKPLQMLRALQLPAWLALVLVLAAAACSDSTESAPVASVEITGSATDLVPGQVVQLAVRVTDRDGRDLTGRAVTWSSSADLVAAVDQTGLVTLRAPGSVIITAESEGKTAARDLTVRSPVPQVTSLSPDAALPNTAITLTVRGSGFYNGSVVRWNGVNRGTTFVSATELRAAIPASDLSVHGPALVTVLNAAPGGGESNAVTVTVRPSDACQYLPPYAIGSTLDGRVETSDCRLGDGSFADLFSVAIPAEQAVTLRMSSAQLDSYIMLFNAGNSRPFAFNDNSSSTTVNSAFSVLLSAGTYRLYVNTRAANQVGNYTLTSLNLSSQVTGCSDTWIVPSMLTTQTLTAQDCVRASATPGVPFYGDRFHLYLLAGETIAVTMTSTAVNSYLRLLDSGTLTELARDDNSAGGTNARLTFTVSSQGAYIIETTTSSPGQTGSYTLFIP
jgi:hypothetical protein